MIRRLGRFQAVGALGILVQLAAVWLLSRAGLGPIAATALAVECAIIHNFLWHRRWTWRERADVSIASAFLRFQLTNGLLSLLGNVLLVGILVRALPIGAPAANLIAIGICSALNFLSAEFFVFPERSRAKSAP